MDLPFHQPLAVTIRGDAVEAVHYGSIAVVDAGGRLVHGVGDTAFPVFTRSTLKPFQALPLIIDQVPAHFGLSERQIALACSSHSGEAEHIAQVADMLARIGCSEHDLQCGAHVPLHYSATGTRPPGNLWPTPLQHNCSGKHAGFLAWCRQHGHAIESYLDPNHPLQRQIRNLLPEVFGHWDERIPMGMDGCSAPNYAISLERLALGYARLVQKHDDTVMDRALDAVFAAMTTYPEMVSGTGRDDLTLMRACPGNLVAKFGAESVQALGLRSGGVGIALKIADGSTRALKVIIAQVLSQLGLLSSVDVGHWLQAQLLNDRKRAVGSVVPVFKL